MSHRIASLVTLTLATPLFAQGTSVPPGYEATEYGNHGNGSSQTLGAHAFQHAQVLAGDKLPAGKWSKLSFREARTGTSEARTFKGLTLMVGPHDYSKKSTVFAANFTSTPSTVFTGSINFPKSSATARPLWGQFVAAADMTIPFSQAYGHGGGGACFDFMFSGGTLDNGATWTGADIYHMDGLRDANSTYYNQAVTYLYGSTGAPCFATGQTNYGYFVPFQRNYGINDTTSTANQGMSRLYQSALRLANNATAIGAVSFNQPYLAPVAVPGSCQSLYMDLSGSKYPYYLVPFKTGATGSWNNLSNPILVKYNAALIGIRIWTQCAYDDPTNGFELSMGGSTWTAPQPPVTMLEMVQANDANARNPSGTVVSNNLPIMKVE